MRIEGWLFALITALAIAAFSLTLFIVARPGDPLDGYCYGVVDKTGTMHPSAEPIYTSELGMIAKVPGEYVHFIQAPAYVIIDTECVCEKNLESGACLTPEGD